MLDQARASSACALVSGDVHSITKICGSHSFEIIVADSIHFSDNVILSYMLGHNIDDSEEVLWPGAMARNIQRSNNENLKVNNYAYGARSSVDNKKVDVWCKRDTVDGYNPMCPSLC